MCVQTTLLIALVAGALGQGKLGGVRDLSTIGLKIALPAGMTELSLDALTDWARVGVKGEGNAYDQILVLSALPQGTNRDAKSAAAAWVRQAGRERAEYKAITQRLAKWLDDGWEVLATYRVDKKLVTSMQWFGWRSTKPAIVYVLTYDVVDGRGDAMRTVLQAVARSCKTTPIRPASTQPVRPGKRRFLPKRGLSLRVPDSLRLIVPNRENMLLRAGAVDYVRDRLLPVLTLTTNPVKPGETPQARLQRSIETLLPSLKPADGKVESQSSAKIGNRQAHQVLFSLTRRRQSLTTAVRLTIWRDQALVLSLTYPSSNVKELADAIEKVAATFQFE
jgi:hypothetical protein